MKPDDVLKIILPENNKVKLQEKINKGRSQRSSAETNTVMRNVVQILFDQLKIRFAHALDAIYFVGYRRRMY